MPHPTSSWVALFLISVITCGCAGSDTANQDLEFEQVEDAAQATVEALDNYDWSRVADLAYEDMGVIFTPYGYVNPDEHLAFLPKDIRAFPNDTTTYTWGQFDGKGNPINKTIREYYERFVYPIDFAEIPPAEPNEQVGTGDSINNIEEIFHPLGNVSYVEYHHPGTDEYDGMDWRSLRLVFLEEESSWKLIAIVHDQWTI